jgi:hypothetical protein
MSQVLAELKQYAQEVDVDFVRKSVKAIGMCGWRPIKISHWELCEHSSAAVFRTSSFVQCVFRPLLLF